MGTPLAPSGEEAYLSDRCTSVYLVSAKYCVGNMSFIQNLASIGEYDLHLFLRNVLPSSSRWKNKPNEQQSPLLPA
jgi:hypothetical protein